MRSYRIEDDMKFQTDIGESNMTALDPSHWRLTEYTQRILLKDWRSILLTCRDKIIVNNEVRQLIAKSIGAGVYEITKAPL